MAAFGDNLLPETQPYRVNAAHRTAYAADATGAGGVSMDAKLWLR